MRTGARAVHAALLSGALLPALPSAGAAGAQTATDSRMLASPGNYALPDAASGAPLSPGAPSGFSLPSAADRGTPPSGEATFGADSRGGTAAGVQLDSGLLGSTGVDGFVGIEDDRSGDDHGFHASGRAVTLGAAKTFEDGSSVALAVTTGRTRLATPGGIAPPAAGLPGTIPSP